MVKFHMDNCIWSWLRQFSIAFQLSLGGDIEKNCDFQIEAHQIYDFASILKEISLQTVDDKSKHTIECDLFTSIYWEDSDYGWLHFALIFCVENALNFSNQYQHLLGWKHCPKFKNKPELLAPIILIALIHNKYETKAGPIAAYKTTNKPFCSFIENDWWEFDSKM